MAIDEELNTNGPIEMDSEEDEPVENQVVLDDQDSDLDAAALSQGSPGLGEGQDAPIVDVDDSPIDDEASEAETDDLDDQSVEVDQPADHTDTEVPQDTSDTKLETEAAPLDIPADDLEDQPPADVADEPEDEALEGDVQESAAAYDLLEEERVSESEAIDEEMITDAPLAEAEMDEVGIEDTPVSVDTESVEDVEMTAVLDEVVSEELVPTDADQEDDGREWYVVHCYSGYENKVRHNLEQRIETMGMKDEIFDVVVPTEEEIEVKDGKRRTVERRVFPGYILVNLILSEESWYVVRNTPGVTSFVGMGNEPIPLRPEEVSQIVKRMEADAPRIKVSFKSGERVRIIDGPFNEFRGTVAEIDMERAKVRIMVNFFGRETPVELDFLQVEKA